MRRFYSWKYLLIIAAFGLMVVPWWIRAQAPSEEQMSTTTEKVNISDDKREKGNGGYDFDKIRSDLAGKNAVFEQARETFFNNQTTANKKSFDEQALVWAQELLVAQNNFATAMQERLGQSMSSAEGAPGGWLDKEIDDIRNLQKRLENANTYAAARNIVNESGLLWQKILSRIRQSQVWLMYDQVDQVLKQAAFVSSVLEGGKRALSQENKTADWSTFDNVFSSYKAALDSAQDMLVKYRGSFDELPSFQSLDEKDDLWVREKKGIDELVEALQNIALLQNALVGQFARVAQSIARPPQ